MPDQEVAFLDQKALLWAAAGFDDYGRHSVSATSAEIDCRWVKRRGEAKDPKGNVVSIDASLMLDQAVAVGSVVWEGSLQDLVDLTPGTMAETSIKPTSNLMQVITYDETPDLKARARCRTAGLKRLTDSMAPTGS